MSKIIIHDCEQGTDEWLLKRLGKVTGTSAKVSMSKGKGRNTLLNKLAYEIVEGKLIESGKTPAMQWGNDTEPEAVEHYEQRNDVKVDLVGFVELNQYVGVSPDGLVGDDGMVEVKCPSGPVHLGYVNGMIEGSMPSDHEMQVQHQLYVTGRKWCDFISYNPRVENVEQFYSIRVERDEKVIATLQVKTEAFVEELKKFVENVTVKPF